MAEIVLGLATAHSPMLSLPADMWSLFEERDKGNSMLTAVPGGEVLSYEDLLKQADPAIAEGISQAKFTQQYEACQIAITTLEKTLAEAQPDSVVIIGDDQEELFFDDNMPMFSIYWGDTMHLTPRGIGDNASPATKASPKVGV